MTKCCIYECQKNTFCRGYCKIHYARARRSGELTVDPLRAHGSMEDRFWRRVKKTDGCWTWTGGKYNGGYGFLRGIGGRNAPNVAAHRFSYMIHKGDIPQGMVIMHSCDNPACVNPDHLSVGTYKDNTQDMISKGRRANNPLTYGKGEVNPRALLNEAKVRYIRASKASHAALARELGVSDVCIFKVRNRQTWSHIE